MLIRIYPENPNEKAIAQVVDILRRDGVIVYPTDSVYAFGCSLHSTRAIERIRTLTGKQGDDFSIICHDLSGIAAYARVDTPTFKLMKRNLPGPFTFLLSASNKVPDKFLDRKKNGRRPDPCERHPAGHRRGIGQSVGDRLCQNPRSRN